jgi:hypothetical protein
MLDTGAEGSGIGDFALATRLRLLEHAEGSDMGDERDANWMSVDEADPGNILDANVEFLEESSSDLPLIYFKPHHKTSFHG